MRESSLPLPNDIFSIPISFKLEVNPYHSLMIHVIKMRNAYHSSHTFIREKAQNFLRVWLKVQIMFPSSWNQPPITLQANQHNTTPTKTGSYYHKNSIRHPQRPSENIKAQMGLEQETPFWVWICCHCSQRNIRNGEDVEYCIRMECGHMRGACCGD